jgi:hypothetical protein
MPTWLPPSIATLNRTTNKQILVESRQWPGVFLPYGWTNGIANYLFDRWALFADSTMLLQGWGEFNTWFPDMETKQLYAPLLHASTGTHDGSAISVQHNATVNCVFRIPLPGCQSDLKSGLPVCAMRSQRLYIRLWLKDRNDLVESGLYQYFVDASGNSLPEYEVCPQPWGGQRIQVSGVVQDEVTLQDYEMKQPYIYGRFTVLHLEKETRELMVTTPQTLIFHQQLREDFTIENRDWNPTASFKKRLEIHGFFQSLFIGILGNVRAAQNKYRDIVPPGGGDWVLSLSLNVNGVDRIFPWSPKIFKTLANNTQMSRDVDSELYFLIFGVNPESEPAGCCNLTRTQKVLLLMQLADIPLDPLGSTKQAAAFVMGLSWNILDISNGVARVRFSE